MQGNKYTNVEFQDIDHSDYPDYVDANIVSADCNGEPMTDEEIELIPSEIVYELLMDYLL